jgi:DNA-binding transcriptional MerR regulator
MLFTIKDIENLSGIKAHTIRVWEQRYSLIRPNRSDTNIRYYSNDELRIILNVSVLCKYGYKISQINKMSRPQMFENVLSLTDAEAIANVTVNQLLQSMIEFDIELFENLLNNYITSAGLEKTIIQIIFPFLDKVGILWLSNHVIPVQERLVSNIIRQKIITGIDSLPKKKTSSLKICLFLPEGELHELSLLVVSYLLKKSGVCTIYLGANIPLDELKIVASLKKPDYLYTHITTAGQGFNFEKFLTTLNKEFRNYPIIISGRHTASFAKIIPPKIILKKSFSEVREFIKHLK